MKKISLKRKNFVKEYLRLKGDAVTAYKRTIAIDSNISRQNAHSAACQLLNKPEIVKYINKLTSYSERSAGDVINELFNYAFYSIDNFYNINDDGTIEPKSINEIDDNLIRLIEDVRTNKEGKIIKYKLPDKMRALELLAKILRINNYQDNNINYYNNNNLIVNANNEAELQQKIELLKKAIIINGNGNQEAN